MIIPPGAGTRCDDGHVTTAFAPRPPAPLRPRGGAWDAATLARRTALAVGSVAAAGAACVAWGHFVERHLYTLRRFTVPVLPPGALPLRVLHVSDLHLVPGQERRMRWVHDLAALEPDLVVNTGDNMSSPAAVPDVLATFDELLDVPGVFVCGSNDYYSPRFTNPLRYLTQGRSHPDGSRTERDMPWRELTAAFRERGWADLTHARSRIELEGVRLEFVGVDDPHLGLDEYERVSGPAADDADLTIGVTHAPYQRVLDAMVGDGAGLVLAGHTHGGQVCLPGWGALTTNCDLDAGRVKGVSRWWPGAGTAARGIPEPDDAAWLEVSAGLGHSPMAPYRFACRPEATLLTLVPRESSAPADTRPTPERTP